MLKRPAHSENDPRGLFNQQTALQRPTVHFFKNLPPPCCTTSSSVMSMETTYKPSFLRRETDLIVLCWTDGSNCAVFRMSRPRLLNAALGTGSTMRTAGGLGEEEGAFLFLENCLFGFLHLGFLFLSLGSTFPPSILFASPTKTACCLGLASRRPRVCTRLAWNGWRRAASPAAALRVKRRSGGGAPQTKLSP